MDKLLYTAVSGANRVMAAQALKANNLSNVDTAGFRADLERVQALAVSETRVMSQLGSAGVSGKAGELAPTGRTLDLAVRERGLFTLMTRQGEAYSRAGHLELDPQGQLVQGGLPVAGLDGPLVLPEYRELFVGDDGTISVIPAEGGVIEEVGRLKLVNPEMAQMRKGLDGLLRPADGVPLVADDQVTVVSGFLEGSNVDAVQELVASMDLSRQFEVQIKLMKSAESLAKAGNRLLNDV
ncbi:flagellar hook-basal body complex protein [Ferrimonas sediminicola]|uniref:Flagellar basal-body rod protein FlgF n=1 Tax=Ferrimonas sediminicola TaxID=2569538 RepID=A0A4U1BCN0_9GAMM|nr:flagellar basal body rod protein FlgF [Ferrimonas sediminicola]TKB47795.1 flagellar hook-basal body complex protein [Ferrimonas sediminicola]